MANRRRFETGILAALIAGAILFVLLLAGVGSGIMTTPVPYHPSPAAPAA